MRLFGGNKSLSLTSTAGVVSEEGIWKQTDKDTVLGHKAKVATSIPKEPQKKWSLSTQ